VRMKTRNAKGAEVKEAKRERKERATIRTGP
jgi:hypothetical protein